MNDFLLYVFHSLSMYSCFINDFFKIFQDVSGFFKIFHVLLKILNDFLFIYFIHYVIMFYQWFWWFFQDLPKYVWCKWFFMFYLRYWVISYYIFKKKYSSFINDFDKFFKIFQDFSWIFKIFHDFFLHFIFVHHFTMIKSCISP